MQLVIIVFLSAAGQAGTMVHLCKYTGSDNTVCMQQVMNNENTWCHTLTLVCVMFISRANFSPCSHCLEPTNKRLILFNDHFMNSLKQP